MFNTSYIETTLPSWYDTSKSWSLTIGRFEDEVLACAITQYCQEHGDTWQPVPASAIGCWARADDSGSFVMRESWLATLQGVRHVMPGPAELLINHNARGYLQLRYPNGQRRDASLEFTTSELEELLEHKKELECARYRTSLA